MCKVYVALDSEPSSQRGFLGAVTEYPFSDISVSNIRSEKQVITRNSKGIRRDSDAYYFLNLQVHGSCRVVQCSRETITNPDEFSIVDSTEPFVHDYFTDEWEMYSFKIPKRVLDSRMNVGRDCVARKVSAKTPMGRLVVDYLGSIARNPESLGKSAFDLSKTMVDLIGLSLGEEQDQSETSKKTWKSTLRCSILNYIDLNFADHSISPSKVAAHFGMSTRYLHMLLEDCGETFGKILLAKRLERCAQDLRDGRSVNISDAAFHWGFNDLSHFSRTFRRHFGMPPRDYRRKMADQDAHRIEME
ncbi:helix-turn-helix domain-containing protein [Agrobacterium rhizogenes]|nr:helix-turn-helix domain-containing protein [Rhizobium rhizogenes]NTH35976.1 helix-turn-helix domain-containing protein [Rhizobium rhizogenes]